MYGNPEVTTGGRALKFYASMRSDVRKTEQIKASGSEIIGTRTRAKIVKNKVAPPFKEAEFDIIYGRGISKEGELLDAAVSLDIIHKSGAWFSYGDQRLGQGRENVKEYMLANPDFMAEVEQKVKEHISELSNQMKASYKGGQMHETPVAAAPAETEAPAVATTAASAKAKLDITVDD